MKPGAHPYRYVSIRYGFDAAEMNGIIAEMPIVSTGENPMLSKIRSRQRGRSSV